MDFGDMLLQWENSQKEDVLNKKNAGKKNDAGSKNSVYKKKANADFIEQGFASKQDAQKAEVQRKTVRQQMEEDRKKRINPMEMWLSRYGVIDKDKSIEQYEQSQKLKSHEYVKDMPVDAYLDLHGMTRDEAWKHLEVFVNDCVRRKLKKIMIIHGKGNHSSSHDPILGEVVRVFIERDQRLGASGHPGRSQGGTGATWILIKDKFI